MTLLRVLPLFGLVAMLGGCIGVTAPVTPVPYPVATGTVYEQAAVAPGFGFQCFAGFYQCRLSQQVPLGSQCSCPGLGAPSFGSVR